MILGRWRYKPRGAYIGVGGSGATLRCDGMNYAWNTIEVKVCDRLLHTIPTIPSLYQ